MYNLIFDIGTINLSWCLTLSNNYDITKTEILMWELFNISVPKISCCVETTHNKKIKICKNKAIFYNNGNTINGYCSDHVKLFNAEDKKTLLRISSNKKLESSFTNIVENLLKLLHNIYEKIKSPFYINNNFIFCKNINVYIENQLALSNPKAKSISVVIYTFFKLKIDNMLINNVHFISASIKTKPEFLKKYLTKEEIPDLKITGNKKKVIVLLVKKLMYKLPNSPNNIIVRYKFLKEYDKKDDLADSFVYLFCVNNI